MTPAAKPVVLLIDAFGWLFRAYHALPPLTAADGTPTGAVVGMNNMLKRLLAEYPDAHVAVVFDPSGPTFREALYPEYKAHRDAMPEDLAVQLPLVYQLIDALGLPSLQQAGFEADDVIGTLAVQARASGHRVLIVSSDKDMAQLVNAEVQLLDTMKARTLDSAAVVEKFGVPPERIIDLLALMGDTADNIPGIDGVGPKTAAKWLNEHGSLDAVMAAADHIKGKVGEKLRAGLQLLELSRILATIRTDVPLDVQVDDLLPRGADHERLSQLYARLGMRSAEAEARRQLDLQSEGPEPAADAAEEPTTPAAQTATVVRTVQTPAALDELIQALLAAPLIAFDTETDALDAHQAALVGMSFAVTAGEGWYLPLGHTPMAVAEQLPLVSTLDRLRPLLEDPSRPKLGQHAKYDINVLARYNIKINGLRYDSMLESYVLDAAAGRHDMDSLALRWLQHRTISFEDVAGRGKQQLSFDQVALEQAAPYAAEDADITLRLHQCLHARLAAVPSLLRVLDEIEIPLVPVLAEIEQRGVRVDPPLLKQISDELAQGMSRLEQQATELVGRQFNLGSPKQLQQILFEELKLRVVARTPKGDPSTGEEVLDELAAEHPLPQLILDWRGMQKLRSTYTENLPLAINPRTGRIHTSYHQAVAATGRLSSSDPNLQNIPVRTREGRRIRQAFVAEPGMALLSIDYSQIELRLMAHFSGDASLRQAFIDDRDIHQATAAEVFEVPIEQVSGEQRRAAKAINFGLIYGISAFGLARNLGISRAEAAATIERFFARYPGVRRYMDDTRARAHQLGYVETLCGRRLYLPQISSRNQNQRAYAERTAINAPLQGTAADLIKMAMIELHGYLRANAPQIGMIMQVHDELVFEGPEAALREQLQPICQRMCAAVALEVPLAVDYGIGANWDAAHQVQGRVTSTR